MHNIKAKFLRFSDVPLTALLGEVGVYVIWDDGSPLIPAYIGEGNLVNRIGAHWESRGFRPPFDGYFAVPAAPNPKRAKQNSTILEAMLLWVADRTGRTPDLNRQGGRLSAVVKKLVRHPMVRANLSGYDPFSPPRQPRILQGSRRLIRIVEVEGELGISDRWQQLRTKS